VTFLIAIETLLRYVGFFESFLFVWTVIKLVLVGFAVMAAK